MIRAILYVSCDRERSGAVVEIFHIQSPAHYRFLMRKLIDVGRTMSKPPLNLEVEVLQFLSHFHAADYVMQRYGPAFVQQINHIYP